jgi:hypothetical protein
MEVSPFWGKEVVFIAYICYIIHQKGKEALCTKNWIPSRKRSLESKKN